jgi:TrmH family RNA methyltransferase
MSDTKTPQGILCIVRQSNLTLSDILSEKKNISLPDELPPLYLLLEDIKDPGNLGTIFRTAEAAGITAIIMSRTSADIYNPKTVRATMGSIFRVPFAYADELPVVIRALRQQNIEIYAACPDSTENYDHCDYRSGSAFLIGNESQGLNRETKDSARNIKIPMVGTVESLNAATAAAILLYEANRQRRL